MPRGRPKLLMDELIQHLASITDEVIDRLEEMTYEDLENFVEERQQIVDRIMEETGQHPLDSRQKEKVKQILSLDTTLLTRMNVLRLDAQDWLHKRNQAKMQRNVYEAAYAPDSLLMDRRK